MAASAVRGLLCCSPRPQLTEPRGRDTAVSRRFSGRPIQSGRPRHPACSAGRGGCGLGRERAAADRARNLHDCGPGQLLVGVVAMDSCRATAKFVTTRKERANWSTSAAQAQGGSERSAGIVVPLRARAGADRPRPRRGAVRLARGPARIRGRCTVDVAGGFFPAQARGRCGSPTSWSPDPLQRRQKARPRHFSQG